AHREGSKAGAWSPASRADQLIEDGMEHRGVCRQSEWFFAIPREANDRPGPRRRIARIAREVAPHDRATLFGQMLGKRPVDADEAVPDELLDLRVAQRMRLRVVRHGMSRCRRAKAPMAPRSFDGPAVSVMAATQPD